MRLLGHLQGLHPIGGFPDDLKVRLGIQQVSQPGTQYPMIIRQQYSSVQMAPPQTM